MNELAKYWLTPVCGGHVPPVRIVEFFEEKEIDPLQVNVFKYRGDGCPGGMECERRSGKRGATRMMDLYGGDSETTWPLTHHRAHKGMNNRTECLYVPTRKREKNGAAASRPAKPNGVWLSMMKPQISSV